MNLGQIARLLSGFIWFFTLSMVVPLAVSLVETHEMATTVPFVGAMVTGLVVAILLWFAGRSSSKNLFRREGLAMVGLAWFLASALAAIPFVWSGAIPGYADAYFESVSGLTTTGATVLGTGESFEIEELPPSILLWRSMLQWMGGIGIVLVFIVLLPSVGVTGSRLLSSEQVGMSDDAVRPRMAQQARRLLVLYVVLTLLAGLAYRAVGMGSFDAVCHSFTTMASGGFSTHNHSIGGYDNPGIELVAIVFMFLAGCNFLLVLSVLLRRNRSARSSVLHRIEFKVYVGLILVVTLGIALSLYTWPSPVPDRAGVVYDYSDFGRCLRSGVFQAVSILTSTGYVNADFQGWPKAALFLLFACMFIGGCTGSTSGGFKVLRIVVCAKLASYVLRHFVRPRTVEKLRVGSDVIPDHVVTAITGLMLLWVGTVAVGAIVLALEPGVDMISACTGSMCMMGCIGPAFGDVAAMNDVTNPIDIGPYGGYGMLHSPTKIFMSLQMVLGRLEILAPLAILTPGFWKR